MSNAHLSIQSNVSKIPSFNNKLLLKYSATQRVEWTLNNLPNKHIVSSSFGIQSAVMLHMMSTIDVNIPIILIDTGYLLPETYQYVEKLTEKLMLNLYVYQAKDSLLEDNKNLGDRWQKDPVQLERYHQHHKVAPFEKAMLELNANTWFSGIRHQQSDHRKNLSVIEELRGHYKVHPIIDWSQQDVEAYLIKHQLPDHPLKAKGYKSVGDIHSTKILSTSSDVRQTRFSGKQRECGLHL